MNLITSFFKLVFNLSKRTDCRLQAIISLCCVHISFVSSLLVINLNITFLSYRLSDSVVVYNKLDGYLSQLLVVYTLKYVTSLLYITFE